MNTKSSTRNCTTPKPHNLETAKNVFAKAIFVVLGPLRAKLHYVCFNSPAKRRVALVVSRQSISKQNIYDSLSMSVTVEYPDLLGRNDCNMFVACLNHVDSDAPNEILKSRK